MAADRRRRGAASPRSTYHHGDLRHALVTAALDLVAEGVDEPSLREVARRARVSPGAPYHHFAGKDELLIAVALDGFAQLERALAVAVGSDSAGADRLRRRCAAYVVFAAAHPQHYRVMFRPSLMRHAASSLPAVAGAAFDALATTIDQARPGLVADRRRELAMMIWAMAHGLVTLWNDGLLAGEGPVAHLAEACGRRAVELTWA